jgi:hypothetical protein
MNTGIYWKIMFREVDATKVDLTPALDIAGFGLVLLDQTIGLGEFQRLENNTLAEIHEMVSRAVFESIYFLLKK